MNLLVTAGNTLVPIDRVRGITNIFTGRTGAAIARCAHDRGHDVTLLTSHPETVDVPSAGRWALHPYQTFDELQSLMRMHVETGSLDVVVHSAAVSDYRVAGVYGAAEGTRFDPTTAAWHGEPPRLEDRAAGKVKSDEPELWLRLVRTNKIVDMLREKWGFKGLLVKFKLEVGVTTKKLLEIAERSRVQSQADLMVANTLDEASRWAYLGPVGGNFKKVKREDLAPRLLEALEHLHAERSHG
jgi:phosphopantothenoylcysteine synthetase/decarboxylase